jgi:hypothetical protein
MHLAYENACAVLELSPLPDQINEILVTKIVEFSKTEDDPDRLCERVLAYYRSGAWSAGMAAPQRRGAPPATSWWSPASTASLGASATCRRGAVLKATEQPIDTGTAAGKCFLDMLGVFAEFETNLRRERQLEGIAKAKLEAPSVAGLIAFGTIDRAEETARLSMSYPLDDLVRAIGLHPDCSALSESLTTYTFLYRPTSHSQEAEGGRPLEPAAGNRPRWFVRVVTPA